MTKAQLLKELDAVGPFPLQVGERRNVKRGGKVLRGLVLGKIRNIPYYVNKGLPKVGESNASKKPKYQELKKVVWKVMKDRDPNFKFSSVQINKNYRMAKHTDARNVGVSYILGLGNYTGGEVIVYDKDGKNPKKIDIKNKFAKFNGSILPHETAPYKGTRYTLVYYQI